MATDTENEQMAAYAEKARWTILAHIQRRLPADSDLAFTAAELRRFNGRRRSQSHFSPYGAAELP